MPRTIALLLVSVVLAVAPTGGATTHPAGVVDPPACEPGAPPIDLPGTQLVPEVHTSVDADPVRYVLWRGTAPSFDGMPLSVDVTVPCDAAPEQPTIVMAHGFTDDKTVWEQTDKTDTVDSADRPGNDHWNNIWFASRGYVVLTYTARGWRDSCGPDTPGHAVSAPAPACAPFEFWMHMNDQRWEVRDAQWLAGSLVQGGAADPAHLAMTGGSYGGAPTLMAALLADQIVCGATAVPPSLGIDPCDGVGDGAMAEWTTPDGSTDLEWAAAVPLYTYGDLLAVLAPNGRVTDGWSVAPPSGNPTEPFGVPLEGTVSGLLLVANVYASVAPPGTDPESDITTSTQRMVAGEPFPLDDPAVADSIDLYRARKSAVTIEPQGDVPIFWVQGMTDALFPAFEPLSMQQRLQAADRSYPMKIFLGDLGHDYAAERQEDWDAVKPQMNAFIDHYLRPDRTPSPPVFDVSAAVTRCLDPDATHLVVDRPSWADFHPDRSTFRDDTEQQTSTENPGPAGLATDPISRAMVPGPESYKGCRIMRPSETDTTTATYEFDMPDDLLLLGGAVVELTVSADAGGIPLAVRLWDVDAGGEAQALVARGVYRMDEATPVESEVTFQLTPQAYLFEAGHSLKVEVTGNDSPYLQQSNIAAGITVHDIAVTLPTDADLATAPAPSADAASGEADGSSPGLRAGWIAVAALVAAIAAGVGSRRVRRARRVRS